MKVFKKKTRIPLYSWLPTGTYHKNLAIWKKIPSNFGEFGPFLPCKILLISRNNIFQVEILPVKKTLI
jgi:hypothetical protein